MKCLQRCCCLLCALVLLSTVFSINAHAESNVVDSVTVDVSGRQTNGWGTYYYSGGSYNIGTTTNTTMSATGVVEGTNYGTAHITYKFTAPIMIKEGATASVKVSNLLYDLEYSSNDNTVAFYDNNISSCRALIIYDDGSMEYVDNVSYSNTYSKYSSLYEISFSFEPKGDASSFELITQNSVADKNLANQTKRLTANFVYGQIPTQPTTVITYTQDSKAEGLLGGLLEWVKGIKGKIDDTFSSITSGFSNIGKWFAELPSKLWEVISNGLKNLFVPDEDFIVQYKEDMDTMLSDKLGAVYQVVDITLESWDRISASDEQNSINLPQTTINLPENNKFSFGGYDVKIVPDGFDVLANAIKLIGGICVTILFVNGLRKRYDEIMGVEK